MSEEEFMKQQYLTLREEIRASKARAFVILILAAVFIPAAGLAAQRWGGAFATASMPFITLVLMLAFITEQNGIIRAGRYLREYVEPRIEEITTWESWLESNHKLRSVDRYFFGSFVLVFLLFYAVGAGTAVTSIAAEWGEHFWYAAAGYAVGGLWFVTVLLRHWHSCTTTTQG
ncbi:MAG: hypothetical protein JXQ75_22720 [Phycisphaerae bacterium]|nr:hypothetical protein [Phycisphaerae bacterium]